MDKKLLNECSVIKIIILRKNCAETIIISSIHHSYAYPLNKRWLEEGDVFITPYLFLSVSYDTCMSLLPLWYLILILDGFSEVGAQVYIETKI